MTTGFRKMCAELGVRLVNLRESGFAEVPLRGELLSSVYIARPVVEADLVINLPKLKTHSFTVFTGAVKNMYGVIPYGLRLEGHRRFLGRDSFSRMLVDVYSAVPRQFTLMDAVVGMEGEGPSAGYPRNVGLVISGADGVAVDAVASRITGHDPLLVPTTARAQARGLGVGDLRSIDVVGEKVEEVEARSFRRSWAATGLFSRKLPSDIYAFVNGRLILTPEVVPGRCSGCLECVKICPAGTIGLVRQKAWIDEAGCIHCLCCHEVCLQRSIRLKQRPLGRLLREGSRLYGEMKSLLRQK
jgi:ferredoxin